MPPIEDETAGKQWRRAWAFWMAFLVAYVLGAVIVLGIINDILETWVFGRPGDGTVVLLTLYCLPLFLSAAGIITAFWKKYATIGFAIGFAIFAPVIVYLMLFWSVLWAVVPAAVVAIEIRNARRQREQDYRRRHGFCLVCGYDLRATPDRCPECGAIPPKSGP
jgi:hypothetical protein